MHALRLLILSIQLTKNEKIVNYYEASKYSDQVNLHKDCHIEYKDAELFFSTKLELLL